MGLTESLAMTPAASVSGFYLGHPQSTYFNVGKVGDDQADGPGRAQRRGRERTAALDRHRSVIGRLLWVGPQLMKCGDLLRYVLRAHLRVVANRPLAYLKLAQAHLPW